MLHGDEHLAVLHDVRVMADLVQIVDGGRGDAGGIDGVVGLLRRHGGAPLLDLHLQGGVVLAAQGVVQEAGIGQQILAVQHPGT